MVVLGTGAAQLDILFQIGSVRSFLCDFGTDISGWTFEFYIKRNWGARTKEITLTAGSGITYPVYSSTEILISLTSTNTNIEEGEYVYELRRTDIAAPLFNGNCSFSFNAPAGTTETELEFTLATQTISVDVSSVLFSSDIDGGTP